MAAQMTFKRYELKYMLTRQQRQRLLETMEGHMQLDQFGHSDIRNLYYDTDTFCMIRHSIEKPMYKEKLRVRSYGPAGPEDKVFVELKKKYDSVVYKRRISLPCQQALACLTGSESFPKRSQIAREIEYVLKFYRTLHPAVFLSYEREAYYPLEGGDFRVTLDENIRFRQQELTLDGDRGGTALLEPDQVLMELKTSGGIPMWMVQFLSRERVYKTSFSKYGTAYQNYIAPALLRQYAQYA
ncbi:MAG: polyphosphate polymerase domain-containing protein [Oscillospiraceae bacterium]|nr:polyphosphate polymerase domain-containing protein [Oscillospiraceae bacterium]